MKRALESQKTDHWQSAGSEMGELVRFCFGELVETAQRKDAIQRSPSAALTAARGPSPASAST
jgi:hypothetical protein